MDRQSRLRELGLRPVADPTANRLTRVGRWSWRIDAALPAMGTRVAITAIARSSARLEEAVGRAFAEMDRLIAIFTRFETDSALSVLNDAGRLDRPPVELARALARAARYHRLTRGAFDVSVAPLVELFDPGTGRRPTRPPTAAEIAEARAVTGTGHVQASERGIRFSREGMRVTTDGIAKGFIVDAMAAVLEAGGVRRYLVDGGGDIRTRGRAEGRRPWTIAVRDPDDPSSFLDAVRPGRGAVATSGGYERRFAGPYHHLVDGASGTSPRTVRSVSVRAPNATDADALATAAFILGPTEGVALIDDLADCACLVIDRDGRRHTSRGWKSAPLDLDATE